MSEHIWCNDFLVRSFYLKNVQTQETRTLTQFHFLSWPAQGIPTSTRPLLDFRRYCCRHFGSNFALYLARKLEFRAWIGVTFELTRGVFQISYFSIQNAPCFDCRRAPNASTLQRVTENSPQTVWNDGGFTPSTNGKLLINGVLHSSHAALITGGGGDCELWELWAFPMTWSTLNVKNPPSEV